MEVLSSESVEKLRAACLAETSIVSQSFDDILDDFNLTLVPLKLDTDALPPLKLPEGITQDTNFDLENCKIIYDSLPNLTASKATDERLWVTLCFRDYSEYVSKRWPLDRAKTPSNHVQDHWFSRTARNRMRDNGIGRLWWMAHIAKRVPGSTIDEVLTTLFFNSDYRSSLLERNTSANAINVVVSILSISQKAFDSGVEFNRDKFRNFMKKVDLVGKRTSLPSLGQDELEQILSPLYAEAYDLKKKKAGFLSIFSRD